MNLSQRVVQTLAPLGLIGCMLVGCESNQQVEKKENLIPKKEEVAEEKTDKDRDSKETITVRGLLEHNPQDVKSTEAWLGHEFMVGDKPIRATRKVSREDLLKMVGQKVEIQGVWNAGEKWEPPKPADDDFFAQRPTFPDEVTVIMGSGIEAISITKLEK